MICIFMLILLFRNVVLPPEVAKMFPKNPLLSRLSSFFFHFFFQFDFVCLIGIHVLYF